MKSSLKDRLLAKAIPEPNSGCWLFDGYTTPDGYGRISVDGYSSPAHRVSYELFCGEIPAGKQIDHLCRNRCCVCPDHLEAVTPRENFERGLSPSILFAARQADKEATHCKRGHQFTPENTLRVAARRRCRECSISARRVATLQPEKIEAQRLRDRQRAARRSPEEAAAKLAYCAEYNRRRRAGFRV